MPTRRMVLATGGALAVTGGAVAAPSKFVSVDGLGFRVEGRAYRYAGANLWYGAYIGADAGFGNRERLKRELDRLAEMGVDNLRVLGSSEDSPLKNSISPSFRNESATYNETLLTGLDYLLAEMGRRQMRAVVYLTNFWEWSGGMMAYLRWANGGRYINMNDPAHPWPQFPDWNADFYKSEKAIGLYHDYVRAVVTRTNSITGVRYRDDPTIMSWQLANEPRPGGSDRVGVPNLPNFYRWIRKTATLIKSLDGNHLVSTGHEGLKGCLEREACVTAAHQPPIDYVTAHIWPQNWGWADARDLPGTHPGAMDKVRDYIERHVAIARGLGRPLVIEEFGYPRDGASYAPGSPTTFRDLCYGEVYKAVMRYTVAGPLAGSNFWAWSGEERAGHADHVFQPGDVRYLGDPPHEPQGWYGVFDVDSTTMSVVRAHAKALKAL